MISQMMQTVNTMIQGAAFRVVGGIFSGALLTVFFMKIQKGFGMQYVWLCVGGLLIVALLSFLIFLLWRVLQNQKAKQMEGALGSSIKNQQQRQQVKEAVSSLRDKWDHSMMTLKGSNIHIYDLPWILLIGEPQSGKTTTLRQSGIDFPLGREALSGTGGTVNCDWWFANDAVIIDTAGRFTMPVDSAPDREEWRSFLKLLTKYRPKCPISGVIVTIPATSLIEDSPTVIEEKADRIREKLLELVTELGIEFPIYIMVSKSDLLPGFTEFCGSLASVENTQILGWNRDGLDPVPFEPEQFASYYHRQANRFYQWALRRLRSLPVSDEATRIFSFPTSFLNVKDHLGLYLKSIFRADRFHVPLFWRGCFFSSGIQLGQAISKALNELDGVEYQSRLNEVFERSRPYFIYNFYKKVFLEKGLVKRVAQLTKREKRIRMTVGIFALLFSLISGVLLWTGYQSLTTILNPMKTHITTSSELLSVEEDTGLSQSAGETVFLVDALKKNRGALESDRVALLFLKGRENSIVKDLRKIEDTLLVRGLFRPIISRSNDLVNTVPENFDEKRQLLSLILQNLSILTSDSFNTVSLERSAEVLAGQDAWFDIPYATAERLITSYPRGQKLTEVIKDPGRFTLQIQRQMGYIHEFWRETSFEKWKTFQARLNGVLTAYRKILETDPQFQPIKDPQPFYDNVAHFKSVVNLLENSSKDNTFLFPEQLLNACVTDYDQLTTATTDREGVPVTLSKVIERDKTVCYEQAEQIKADRENRFAAYRFLIDENGNIHPELSAMLDILSIEFHTYFTDSHKAQLNERPNKALHLVDVWSSDWKAQSEGLRNAIKAKLDAVVQEEWEKEHLSHIIDFYIDDAVWRADVAAVQTAVEVILGSERLTEKFLHSGMEPPYQARIKWLKPRFTQLAQLNTWLYDKHGTHVELPTVSNRIMNEMTLFYSDFLTFWRNTIGNYYPEAPFEKVTSWRQFKRLVQDKRGLFVNPGEWPFNAVLDNISLESLNHLKASMGDEREKNVMALEREVEKTARAYSETLGNLDRLSSAQLQFSRSVDAFSRGPVFCDEKDEKIESLRSLSRFRHYVDSGRAAGEIIAKRLEKIERNALRLLPRCKKRPDPTPDPPVIVQDPDNDPPPRPQPPSGGGGNAWEKFQFYWYPVSNKFPFERVKNKSRWEQIETQTDQNKRNEVMATLTISEFDTFFLDPKYGLSALLMHYKPKDKFNEIHRYIVNCQAWGDFLYDKLGRPKVHDVNVSIEPSDSKVAKRFTSLNIQGLKNKQNNRGLRLRFSGKYKFAEGLWSLNKENDFIARFTNDETGKEATLLIEGGDIAFPAYLLLNGRRVAGSDNKKWLINLKVPDIESGAQSEVSINAIFDWDEPLPYYIPWPSGNR